MVNVYKKVGSKRSKERSKGYPTLVGYGVRLKGALKTKPLKKRGRTADASNPKGGSPHVSSKGRKKVKGQGSKVNKNVVKVMGSKTWEN